MSRSLRSFGAAFLLIGLLLSMGLFNQAEATVTAKSARYTEANGITVTYFTHTWVTRTDTISCPVVIGGKTVTPTMPFNLYIMVARGATDSIPSLGVRWEHSTDNITWQPSTIGTDSTTWFTTTVYSATASYNFYPYKLLTYPINGTTGLAGFHPYNRIVIYGRTANTVGTRIKVYYGVQ